MNRSRLRLGRISTWEPGRNAGDADIDFESALDLADDQAFDALAFIEGFFDFIPDFEILGALARQLNAAALVLRGIEVDIDIVADFGANVALAVGELMDRNLAFGLVTDIDQDMSRRDANHPSFDDTAGFTVRRLSSNIASNSLAPPAAASCFCSSCSAMKTNSDLFNLLLLCS